MTIKKYFATADNTISNAFDESLLTSNRATGSNMGASDILEVFQIYGQATTSSAELSRVLIQFDTAKIASDRTALRIPASGSVKFYLNLYNAKHSSTLPENFDLTISAVSASWQEGNGLDMVNYTDKTYEGTGSNWQNASGIPISEVSKFTFSSDTASDYGAGSAANYIKLYNKSTLINFWFNDGAGDSAGGSGTWVETIINNTGSKTDFAADFAVVVNGNSNFSANVISNIVYVTASTAGKATAPVEEIGTISGLATEVHLSGANFTAWDSAGGDYLTDTSSSFSQNFPEGYENLSVDVTTLVEQWINSGGNVLGTKTNYGFGIKLKDNLEAEAKSYYTKKFFARGTEFFFKRPTIEAKWDDSIQDDRGSFYASSSLAPASDNLNTLYLYNRIRGRLKNIPAVGVNPIEVSLYTEAGGTQIGTTFTGSYVSTGVYKCQVHADTTDTSIIDVWHSGGVEYHTGSISVKAENAEIIDENSRYLMSIPNLNKEYRNTDVARFKLFVRPKKWSPTVYTVATATPEATVIHSASYEVCRVIDDLVIIPHDTGSNLTTRLSYNVSGNYFNLDMSCFEPGYDYKIKFAFYDEYLASWNHQPYEFKFKVREDEY